MKKLIAILALIATLAPPAALAHVSTQITPTGVERIGAANESLTNLDYSAINVAVVDTGIDVNNPDLNVKGGVDCTEPESFLARILPHLSPEVGTMRFGIDAYRDDPAWAAAANPNATGWDDAMGHGTHVAGIIAARDDAQGVVGVAPNASLWSVRVLGSDGSGSLDSILCGLDWIHHTHSITHISVVNMSLGGDMGEDISTLVPPCGQAPSASQKFTAKEQAILAFHDAICQLKDDGIVVVVAAGNGNEDSRQAIPAGFPEVVTVSNLVDTDGKPGGLGKRVDVNACAYGGYDDTLFDYRNFTVEQKYSSYNGPIVDFAAPGTCILSTIPGESGVQFAAFTGTSMASPHVAGVFVRYLGDYARVLTDKPRDSAFVDAEVWMAHRASEPQTAAFLDTDDYHESIIHIVPKP